MAAKIAQLDAFVSDIREASRGLDVESITTSAEQRILKALASLDAAKGGA
jgi:hypothetical protein